MTLDTLQSEMIQAMKNKDKPRKAVFSGMIDAVKKAAIDKNCRDNISESLVDETLLKYKKMVQEMIDTCPAERGDLLEEYKKRYEIMSEFAPKQMDAAEVKAYLQEKFADVIATGNKGQIMKAVMADLKGKADGKVINGVVAELMQ